MPTVHDWNGERFGDTTPTDYLTAHDYRLLIVLFVLLLAGGQLAMTFWGMR